MARRNALVVSDRVLDDHEQSAKIRRGALLWDCGCRGNATGKGLDLPAGEVEYLWKQEPVPGNSRLDFDRIYRLRKSWCPAHGANSVKPWSLGSE